MTDGLPFQWTSNVERVSMSINHQNVDGISEIFTHTVWLGTYYIYIYVIWNGVLLILWNPMELADFLFGDSRVPWNSMEYPMSKVTWFWLKWQSQSSMEFHGTKWYFIWRPQGSMEFHGIFNGIPWNTCVIWNGALLIPWNHLKLGWFFYLATPEFHGIPWSIPCK